MMLSYAYTQDGVLVGGRGSDEGHRAKARIGLKNLAYYSRRLVQLELHAMAGVP